MKFEKWDQKEKINLYCAGAEAEIVNDRVVGFTFYDHEGDVIMKHRVSSPEYNHLDVLLPAKMKYVKKFQLSGQVTGLLVDEFFDSKHEANNRKEELSGRLDEEKFSLDIKEVEVPEE